VDDGGRAIPGERGHARQPAIDQIRPEGLVAEHTFEVMTGTPAAMASSGGRPNPSYRDGNTKTVASR
jgi:hypothetical protein